MILIQLLNGLLNIDTQQNVVVAFMAAENGRQAFLILQCNFETISTALFEEEMTMRVRSARYYYPEEMNPDDFFREAAVGGKRVRVLQNGADIDKLKVNARKANLQIIFSNGEAMTITLLEMGLDMTHSVVKSIMFTILHSELALDFV